MPPDSESAGLIPVDDRLKSHDSADGGLKPDNNDAESILSCVSRNLPGFLRNSAVALNLAAYVAEMLQTCRQDTSVSPI